jgi:hypothetical protein
MATQVIITAIIIKINQIIINPFKNSGPGKGEKPGPRRLVWTVVHTEAFFTDRMARWPGTAKPGASPVVGIKKRKISIIPYVASIEFKLVSSSFTSLTAPPR